MRMLSIIFLLGIAISANSESCPASKDIYPCYCSKDSYDDYLKIWCSNYNNPSNMEELTKAMKHFVGRKNLNIKLTYFDLTEMPLNIFEGIEVQSLEIHKCALPNVTKDDQVILLGLEDSIEELWIRNSITADNDLSKLRLGHLRSLKLLRLNENTITEISNSWFENSALEVMRFADNDIQRFADRAFAGMGKLKTLDISGGGLPSLKRSMLPTPADNFFDLELENNSLTSLEEDIFTDMPALDNVMLRRNRISTLDRKTWEPVWEHVVFLDLTGNPIQCDSSLEWAFGLRRPHIGGTCGGPGNMKWTSINYFIDAGKRN